MSVQEDIHAELVKIRKILRYIARFYAKEEVVEEP